MNSGIWGKIIISIGFIGFVIVYCVCFFLAFEGLKYAFDLSQGWAAFITFILSYSKLNIVLFIFILIGLYHNLF